MTKAEKNRIACRAYYEANRERILNQKKNSHANYFSWRSMIQRCTNPKRLDFKYYGGRGITVCNQWLYSFEQFTKDMGVKPSRLHTLERINGDKNYEPSNCRWATRAEQANNLKTTRKILYQERQHSLSSLARELDVPIATLYQRIKRFGESTAILLSQKK